MVPRDSEFSGTRTRRTLQLLDRPSRTILNRPSNMDGTRRIRRSKSRKSGHRRPQPNHATSIRKSNGTTPKQLHNYMNTSNTRLHRTNTRIHQQTNTRIHDYTNKNAITIRFRTTQEFSNLFLYSYVGPRVHLAEDRGTEELSQCLITL